MASTEDNGMCEDSFELEDLEESYLFDISTPLKERPLSEHISQQKHDLTPKSKSADLPSAKRRLIEVGKIFKYTEN